MTTSSTYPDLAEPSTFVTEDLPALWRRLREHDPVHWSAPTGTRPGFWSLTRHADVVAVYRDAERFTSEGGNVAATLLAGGDSAAGRMLAVTDGPRHRAIRALLLRSFSPRLLSAVVDRVRARTRALVEATLDRDTDLAADLADHLPINTVGDLMDIPAADRPMLVDWNNRTLSRYGAWDTDLDEVLARNEILLYFGELAERRRSNPGDDVLSALTTGLVDGAPLSAEEVVFNCYSLILGADESSRMSAIGAGLALAAHPDQWAALRAGEVGLDTATDEVLRWVTPPMHFGRRALVDVELGGGVVRAGDAVLLWNSAANRDPAVFPDPERFDLGRAGNRHVAFGYGAHYCLGAFLGRAHVSSVLEAWREQASAIELTGEPRRLHSSFVHGWSSAPVRVSSAAAR
ncbi:cytochrome P450 [Actinokineospora bangkokensis]|uniref:Cytochrome n=1 Tax=Actinokineospora bangkokensis TaxID=1193682 RepID=A0A1Q9LIR0_9PSEU|nr:cytochrome P450 [Actinokineospora bangkokensis]OLR91937.1 cytochrome [Actinokineospora bangkokensis]